MGLEIRDLVVGPLEVNCYILHDSESKEAIVVDPGDEPERILDLLKPDGLEVTHIVCTHTHFDHVGAIPELKEATKARIVIHEKESEIYEAARDMAAFWGYDVDPLPPPDVFVSEGDEIKTGNLMFRIMHTPGHSPGGICLYGNGVVVTGDTLFAGSVGRTDFPGGDPDLLKESFRRLIALPEETVVLPGHGPRSTIGREKRENFFRSEV
ncbi:MAG: MBL fold metallo-hydrolase [Nitrospirae bacterium]|nr:MBL fold metallo-hydrolase [Nitrospirota bacterium]